jgi:hypothetical protein
VPDRLSNTTSRLIALAASLVDSPDSVKATMKCSDADFLAYCAGRKESGGPELERLIDLIIHEQGKIIAHNRELLADQRARQKK